MKNPITRIIAIVAVASGIIFSCKKKDDPAPDNSTPSTTGSASTTGGTTTGGSTTGGTTGNNLQANSFTYNNRAFTNTTLTLQKDIYGVNNFQLDALSGDTIYKLNVRLAKYLPTSFTGNLILATNTITGTDVWVGLTRTTKSPAPFYNDIRYFTTGGSVVIVKQGGNFTIDCSNVGMNNSLTISSKMVFNIPVIPSANANYTVPTSIPDNQITIGASTFTANQKTINSNNSNGSSDPTRFEFTQTTGGIKSCEFYFAQNYPPSGTYTVVNSQTGLLAGQVYIKYVNSSPLEQYGSLAGGSITVVTDQDDVSITTQNITMNKTFGQGSQTLTLSGNAKH